MFPYSALYANSMHRPRSSPISQTTTTIAFLTKTACLKAHWTRSSLTACSVMRYSSFSRSSRRCMSLSPRYSSQQTSKFCRVLYKRQRQDRYHRPRKQHKPTSRRRVSIMISPRRERLYLDNAAASSDQPSDKRGV